MNAKKLETNIHSFFLVLLFLTVSLKTRAMLTMMMVTLERKRTKMSTMMIVTRRRTEMETMKMATILTPKIMRLQGYYGRIAKENRTFIIKHTFTKRKFCLLVLSRPNFLSLRIRKNKAEICRIAKHYHTTHKVYAFCHYQNN